MRRISKHGPVQWKDIKDNPNLLTRDEIIENWLPNKAQGEELWVKKSNSHFETILVYPDILGYSGIWFEDIINCIYRCGDWIEIYQNYTKFAYYLEWE